MLLLEGLNLAGSNGFKKNKRNKSHYLLRRHHRGSDQHGGEWGERGKAHVRGFIHKQANSTNKWTYCVCFFVILPRLCNVIVGVAKLREVHKVQSQHVTHLLCLTREGPYRNSI